jgi:hypothetical protein
MKRFLKWTLSIIGILFVFAFTGFLYFIPPFTLAPPEEFIRPERETPPTVEKIADPAERAIAERGRYLVLSIGCTGVSATPAAIRDQNTTRGISREEENSHSPDYGTVVSETLLPIRIQARAGTHERRSDALPGAEFPPMTAGIPISSPDALARIFAHDGRGPVRDRHVPATAALAGPPEIPPFSPVPGHAAFAFYGLDYGIDGK